MKYNVSIIMCKYVTNHNFYYFYYFYYFYNFIKFIKINLTDRI